MGTYPVVPSRLLSTGEDLQDVINANAEKLVGKTILDKFGKDLPFLPKVHSPLNFLRPLHSAVHDCNLDPLHRQGTPSTDPSFPTSFRTTPRKRPGEIHRS